MSDGLHLGSVNYGPLYRASSLEAESRRRALGVAGDLLDLGTQVYKMWEDSQLAKAQGDTAVELNTYRADLQRGIDSGAIQPNEEGRIVFSQRIGEGGEEELPSQATYLKDDFNKRLDKLREKYKGSRKVQAYLDSTARSGATELEARALELSLEKAARDRSEALQTNMPEAIRQSIAIGEDSPVLALVKANDWLSPATRDTLIEAARRDVRFGMARRKYKAAAAQQGAEVAISSIDAEVAAGTFTKEQGDQLAEEARTTALAQLNTDTKGAIDAFDGMMQPQPGRASLSPYEAVEAIKGTLRPQTATQVTKSLEAYRDSWVKNQDDTADEELSASYSKNRGDAYKRFIDPANRYTERMTAQTERIWNSIFDSDLRGGGAKTMSERERHWRYDWYWNPAISDPNLRTRLSEDVHGGRLSDEEAGNIMKDISDRKDGIVFREVLDSHRRVDVEIERELQKEKDLKKRDVIEARRTDWHNAIDRAAIRGELRTAEEFAGYTDVLLQGQKGVILFEDERDLGTQNQRQRARKEVLAKRPDRVLSDAEKAQMVPGDLDVFTQQLEVNKDSISVAPDIYFDRGIPAYLIVGQNPYQPGKAFVFRIGIDPATGLERPEMHYQGANGYEEWVDASSLFKMPLAKKSEEQAAAAAAEAAARAARPEVKAAAAAEKLPSVEQKARLDDFLRAARGGTSMADLEAAARSMGVSSEWLLQQALARGIPITGGALPAGAAGRFLGGR